jgi:hypothetical protein
MLYVLGGNFVSISEAEWVAFSGAVRIYLRTAFVVKLREFTAALRNSTMR